MYTITFTKMYAIGGIYFAAQSEVDKDVIFKVYDDVDNNGSLTSPIASLLKNEVMEQTMELYIMSLEKQKCVPNLYLETENNTVTDGTTNAGGALLSNRDIVRRNLRQQSTNAEIRSRGIMQTMTASRNINELNKPDDSNVNQITGWPTFDTTEDNMNIYYFNDGIKVKSATHAEGRRDYKELVALNQALYTATLGLMKTMIINDQQVKPHESSTEIYQNTMSVWRKFLEELIVEVYEIIYGTDHLIIGTLASMVDMNRGDSVSSSRTGKIGNTSRSTRNNNNKKSSPTVYDDKMFRSRKGTTRVEESVNGIGNRKSTYRDSSGDGDDVGSRDMRKKNDKDASAIEWGSITPFSDLTLSVTFCNSIRTKDLVNYLNEGTLGYEEFSAYMAGKNHIPVEKMPKHRLPTVKEREMMLKSKLDMQIMEKKGDIEAKLMSRKMKMGDVKVRSNIISGVVPSSRMVSKTSNARRPIDGVQKAGSKSEKMVDIE